jgi:bis(5'-nucleosyl)-tetraphosphatase (symmetrical)
LLEEIEWRPDRDELWFVGDLVNRGPSSLEVLRWAVRNRDRVTVVLGNHDLHLLSRAVGAAPERTEDTLDAVLGAADRRELLGWLRERPLLHHFGPFVMVHAGLMPEWDIEQASELSREVESRLSGTGHESLLRTLVGRRKKGWSGDLENEKSAASAAAVFSRLRMVDAEGGAQLKFTGSMDDAPANWRPWFQVSAVRSQGYHLLFGHWAMLGFTSGPGYVCLDSGCVYGGGLSALRLEDGALVQQPLVDEVGEAG